jgi:drug/metabolite transporter superfamily protein YnfA
MQSQSTDDFEKAARQQCEVSAIGELWLFLRDNKKWWLLPILIVLLVFAVLMVLSGTGAAPFIYTMF